MRNLIYFLIGQSRRRALRCENGVPLYESVGGNFGQSKKEAQRPSISAFLANTKSLAHKINHVAV